MKKKLICIVLSLVCAFALFGCGDNDVNEFLEVYRIEYSIRSDKDPTNLYSRIHISFDYTTDTVITKEDYDGFESSHQDLRDSSYRILQDKSCPSVDSLKIGDYVAFAYSPYYKRQVNNIETDYLYVKINSDKTITIKNKDGVRTVSSYYFEIWYFN